MPSLRSGFGASLPDCRARLILIAALHLRLHAAGSGITFTVSADDRQRLNAIVAAPTSPQKHV
jgi:hypothetical protein